MKNRFRLYLILKKIERIYKEKKRERKNKNKFKLINYF